jgi:hypothetical protein
LSLAIGLILTAGVVYLAANIAAAASALDP